MLRRLDSVACVSSFDEGASVDTFGFYTGFSSEFSVPCAICTSTTRLRKLWKVKNLIGERASINDSYTKYLPLQLSAAAQTKRWQKSDHLTPPWQWIIWKETKKISKYTLSQGHGAHFKLLKIALLCYLTKKTLCPDWNHSSRPTPLPLQQLLVHPFPWVSVGIDFRIFRPLSSGRNWQKFSQIEVRNIIEVVFILLKLIWSGFLLEILFLWLYF